MARALAASASRAGRKVAFFMRKGADILSKWVGEAERQLRLLFEEPSASSRHHLLRRDRRARPGEFSCPAAVPAASA